MIKTILLGEKEEKFKASAATSILFRRLFKEDIQAILADYSKNTKEIRKLQEDLAAVRELPDSDEKSAKLEEITAKFMPLNDFVADFFPKFAYITWLEANHAAADLFKKLTEQDYFEWLMKYEAKDFTMIVGELLNLWTENSRTAVKSKNL